MNKYKYDFSLDTDNQNYSLTGLASRVKSGQRILELGCSYGYLSKFLTEELNCRVVGVDMDADAIEQARDFCTQVIVADLDNEAWLSHIAGQQFDVVLCADVLEHLKNPAALLARLKPYLHTESRILASVPNVAHASVRLELLQGHFDYETLGILDDTHLHFYTRDGLIALLMQAGYVCCDIAYSCHDLADEVIESCLSAVGLQVTDEVKQVLHRDDAIAYQYIIEARPAKPELLNTIPQPLTPKPLVSSGIYYAELQQTVSDLQVHNQNHQANITRFEETVRALKSQLAAEQVHNKDHQANITRFEETVRALKSQLAAEQAHNKNYQREVSEWQVLGATLDNALFDLTLQLQREQEEKTVLQNQIEQLQTHNLQLQTDIDAVGADKAHLEQVLQRVHKKLSYRMVRGLKDMPANIKQIVLKKEPQELVLEPKENTPVIPHVHDYTAWLAAYGSLSEQEVQAIHAEIATWENTPKIAVLMPVYNPKQACLENAIQSVLAQYYPHFELCIADDASTKAYVKEILQAVEQSDARVKVIFRDNNGHISAASNSALSLVTADYVALMDHDDLLTPDALYWVAKTIIEQPNVQLIYSDEDKMDVQGQRYAPYFKPDWNPELFLSHNFICHLGVYKTAKIRELGGFNADFDGAQDYDLALRYSESIEAQTIVHIPHILYHWRAVEGSTANGVQEKSYAEAKIAKAVQAHLQRQNRLAQVTAHARLPGALRVQYVLPEQLPLVSLIIPTRNGFHLLYRCVESIFAKTDYANYELIIINNGSDDVVTLRYLQSLEKNQRVTVIRDNSPFNYSALNNKAVAQAKGELIALLNNDLEVIHADWLGEMVSYAVHPEVGAVGAKLYYPNDTIQHAGVIIGLGGVAGHSHKHFPRDNPGFCGRLLLSQNLSAVTAACLVLRKEVFDAVGGLDEKNLSIAFNDVDFCLRIKEAGFYNVWTPYAELYHYESATRGYEDTPEKQARFNKEVEYMQQRWGEQGLLKDAAYNVNLTLDREDFSFAWPPR